MREPTTSRVRQLVEDLLAAGCDLMAVGDGYVVNEPEDETLREQVQEILFAFGPRLHLLDEISNYLRHLGRCVEI